VEKSLSFTPASPIQEEAMLLVAHNFLYAVAATLLSRLTGLGGVANMRAFCRYEQGRMRLGKKNKGYAKANEKR
jgi:hypothetical protein